MNTQQITFPTEIQALMKMSLPELISMANQVRETYAISKVELCNILNAKSGLCSQNCKFCAQSGHYKTGAAVYPLKEKAEMLAAAKQAKEIGADRFDIVTSGECLSKAEISYIAEAIHEITTTLNMKMCASLGRLDEEDFKLLKQAGLTRYHHNIETAPSFLPQIVTTHTYEDRVRTIKAAQSQGLEVCSGGIIGLGETEENRVEMALILKELGVDSVPINILMPIPGTPLANQPRLSCQEVIRTIALFRIILKDKIIKLAAGRESILKDFQALAFMAGANGMLIGGYLTIRGREVAEDLALVKEVQALWNSSTIS